MRDVYDCTWPDGREFIPHKSTSVPYFSPYGSHCGVYFDGRGNQTAAGIDQMHVFGTRWSIVAGSPLRLSLLEMDASRSRFVDCRSGGRREIACYPHAVFTTLTDGPFELRQGLCFAGTDRIMLRIELYNRGAPCRVRLFARGGQERTLCRIDAARRCAALTYPLPGQRFADDGKRRRPPITMRVVLPETFNRLLAASPQELHTVEAVGDGVPTKLGNRSLGWILQGLGWLGMQTHEPEGCYAALTDDIRLGKRPLALEIELSMAYETRTRRRAAVTFGEAVESARACWTDTFRALPRPAKASYSLLTRRAAVTLGHLQWAPVHGFRPYRATFPSKGWYNAHWLWDGCFHALGYLEYDPRKAREEISVHANYVDPRTGCIPIEMHEYDRPGRPSLVGHFKDASLRECSQPPLLPWTSWLIHRRQPNRAFLERMYRAAVRHTDYWDRRRYDRRSKLYHWDVEGKSVLLPRNECGWDDTPRYVDGGARWGAVDLHCFLVMHLRGLALMADALKRPRKEAEGWRERDAALVDVVRERLFDRRQGCFADLDRFTGRYNTVPTPVMFFPLWAGAATEEQAESVVRRYLTDRRHFWPALPTVSYSHPSMEPDNYWRGPVWINVAYLVLCGLTRYGYIRERDAIRDTLLGWMEMNPHFAEYYHSRTGEACGRTPYGWSAALALPIALNHFPVV